MSFATVFHNIKQVVIVIFVIARSIGLSLRNEGAVGGDRLHASCATTRQPRKKATTIFLITSFFLVRGYPCTALSVGVHVNVSSTVT